MTAARLRTVVRIDHKDWRDEIPDTIQFTRKAAQSGWTIGRRSLPASHPLAKKLPGPIEISVLLSNNATVRDLNRDHLGKDKPTNVLSFPGDTSPAFQGADVLLGDIILAWQTVEMEARQAEKPAAEHLAHLVIHGVLHLLGYDHESDDDAAVMEGLEVDCMARLGLSNPYATGDKTP
jgi:probable rRNA maturation factor